MNEMIAGGISALGLFLILWGATRGKVQDLARLAERQETELARQLELIHGLHDIYVSYKHFNETIAMFRESHRELRDDMKKVLQALKVRDL